MPTNRTIQEGLPARIGSRITLAHNACSVIRGTRVIQRVAPCYRPNAHAPRKIRFCCSSRRLDKAQILIDGSSQPKVMVWQKDTSPAWV